MRVLLRLAEGVFHNLVAWVLIVLVPVVALTMWAVLREYDALEVVFVFLLGLAAVVVLINQGRQMMPRGKRWESDQALGDELNKWLRERNFRLQDIQDRPPELSFAFEATDPTYTRSVAIIKPIQERVIHLGVKLALTDVEKAAMQGMPTESREEIRDEVAVELTRIGVSFDLRQDLATEGLWVINHNFIVEDMLTAGEFASRHLGLVIRATMLAQVIVSQHLRKAQITVGAEPTVETPTTATPASQSIFDTESPPPDD